MKNITDMIDGSTQKKISAIDLFCGAGGLSLGLQQSGIQVEAGIDIDPFCEYIYKENIKSKFILKDVSILEADDIIPLWAANGSIKLLVGCAPCQPFSTQRRGTAKKTEKNGGLLYHFGRLVSQTSPHVVAMENVTNIRNKEVFRNFVKTLKEEGYYFEIGMLYGPNFGLPQRRKRLILLASKFGPIEIPVGDTNISEDKVSVENALIGLPPLKAGEQDPEDPLHRARKLSEKNILRIRHSVPGGTWRDWPSSLLSPCQVRDTGKTFQSFYGRMVASEPAPTITTQAHNFGAGRFGHPVEDRALSLRESAILQGFPRDYDFISPEREFSMEAIARMIGNAVPPNFGRAIGDAIVDNIVRYA